MRNFGDSWMEIAEYLEDLQKWRVQCDYDDTVPNLGMLVSNALNTAGEIISRCS